MVVDILIAEGDPADTLRQKGWQLMGNAFGFSMVFEAISHAVKQIDLPCAFPQQQDPGIRGDFSAVKSG